MDWRLTPNGMHLCLLPCLSFAATASTSTSPAGAVARTPTALSAPSDEIPSTWTRPTLRCPPARWGTRPTRGGRLVLPAYNGRAWRVPVISLCAGRRRPRSSGGEAVRASELYPPIPQPQAVAWWGLRMASQPGCLSERAVVCMCVCVCMPESVRSVCHTCDAIRIAPRARACEDRMFPRALPHHTCTSTCPTPGEPRGHTVQRAVSARDIRPPAGSRDSTSDM